MLPEYWDNLVILKIVHVIMFTKKILLSCIM